MPRVEFKACDPPGVELEDGCVHMPPLGAWKGGWRELARRLPPPQVEEEVFIAAGVRRRGAAVLRCRAVRARLRGVTVETAQVAGLADAVDIAPADKACRVASLTTDLRI